MSVEKKHVHVSNRQLKCLHFSVAAVIVCCITLSIILQTQHGKQQHITCMHIHADGFGGLLQRMHARRRKARRMHSCVRGSSIPGHALDHAQTHTMALEMHPLQDARSFAGCVSVCACHAVCLSHVSPPLSPSPSSSLSPPRLQPTLPNSNSSSSGMVVWAKPHS